MLELPDVDYAMTNFGILGRLEKSLDWLLHLQILWMVVT